MCIVGNNVEKLTPLQCFAMQQSEGENIIDMENLEIA